MYTHAVLYSLNRRPYPHSGSEKASQLWDGIQDELEELRVAAEKGVPIDLGDGTMIDSRVRAPPPPYVDAEERVTRGAATLERTQKHCVYCVYCVYRTLTAYRLPLPLLVPNPLR